MVKKRQLWLPDIHYENIVALFQVLQHDILVSVYFTTICFISSDMIIYQNLLFTKNFGYAKIINRRKCNV